ncbi:MAG: DUF3363 domain-containing protein [Bryobacterales bacterium]|nr:DUF3363 domain-containing protein [Bryobacterales bacterium]
MARTRPAAGQEFFRFNLSVRSRAQLRNRLFVLQQLGLARRAGGDAWDVKADFDAVLREMQKLSDRQRMIAAYRSLLSNPMLPIRYTPPNEISELTGRVIGHAHDDGSDRPAMILEGADGFVHIIPYDQGIERHRARGLLASGKVFTLYRDGGGLRVKDLGEKTPSILGRSQTPAKRSR